LRPSSVVLLAVPFVLAAVSVRLAAPRIGDASAADTLASDAGAPPPRDGGAARAPKATDTLFIPARIVRSAANRGTVSGDPVPGGVRLKGVSNLGAGLLDGDVVTSVEGAPVATAEAVAQIVAGAVGRGANFVHAVVKRAERTIAVTVEIPR
jgi:serine protease Do